jgi:small-conductance mechanosensitive channel
MFEKLKKLLRRNWDIAIIPNSTLFSSEIGNPVRMRIIRRGWVIIRVFKDKSLLNLVDPKPIRFMFGQ